MKFFDPDRRVFSADKLGHLIGGCGAALVVLPFVSWPLALGIVAVVGAIFELGQWDGVRGTPYLGQPGYGFGLLDLTADLVGALVAILLVVVLR